MGRRPHNVVGLQFGRLTVIATTKRIFSRKNNRNRYVVAKCECGELIAVQLSALKGSDIRSCGCLQRDFARIQLAKNNEHRRREPPVKKTSEYGIWWSMIQRCEWPKHKDFQYWGGRGIKVCSRWRHGENGLSGFKCFFADMGPRPPKHSIDRIDNDGNYEPANCRWATNKQQLANRRPPANRRGL